MIAHETSVGLLNPVRAVGEICRRYDALFWVDAVSAISFEDIDVVRNLFDVCWEHKQVFAGYQWRWLSKCFSSKLAEY